MKEKGFAPAQDVVTGKDTLQVPANEILDADAARLDRAPETAAEAEPKRGRGEPKQEDQVAIMASEEPEHRPSGGVVGGVVGGVAPPRPADENRSDRAAAPATAAAELAQAPTAAPRSVATEGTSLSGQKTSLAKSPAAMVDRSRALLRRMAAEDKVKPAADRVRALGDRRFVREEDYWVDLDCLHHTDAEMVIVVSGSPESEEVFKSLPGLDDLQRTGAAVLVFRSGRNLLLQ